jgi:hypothetical protein
VTIIPLAPASQPGSSNLPEGLSSPAACVTGKGMPSLSRKHATSRASSPLLFGLAPCGVCHAPDITAGAVGSYPTFSPLPALSTIRRHPVGFPPGYHRVTHRRRYSLCGTVRDAAAPYRVEPGTTRRSAKLCLTAKPAWPAPWRYQAHCPLP